MRTTYLFFITIFFFACGNPKEKKIRYVEDGYTRLQRKKQKTNEAAHFENYLEKMTPPIRIINAKKNINEQKISIIYENISDKTIFMINFQCFGNDYNGFRDLIEEERGNNKEIQLLKPKEIGEISVFFESDVFYRELSNVKAYPIFITFEDGSKWILNKNSND